MIDAQTKTFTTELNEFLKNNPTVEQIHQFVSKEPILTCSQQFNIFKNLASPNESGVSKEVDRDTLFGIHPSFAVSCGSWKSRAKRDMKMVLLTTDKGWKLNGYLNPNKSDYIRGDINRIIHGQPCAMCGSIHNIQTDHKNGRKDDPRVWNKDTQLLSDFQPLCQHDNLRKKCKCENCLKTGMRPDARTITFFRKSPFGWSEGNERYDTEHGCRGCVWYDVLDFLEKYEFAISHKKQNVMVSFPGMNQLVSFPKLSQMTISIQ